MRRLSGCAPTIRTCAAGKSDRLRLPACRLLRTVSAVPFIMPPDASSLAKTLRHRRVEAMQSDAELVRDHPDAAERMAEAQRLIREAMYQQSLGRITLAERDQIFGALSFAVESMRALSDTHTTADCEFPQDHDATER